MNSDGGDLERWVMVSVTHVRALLEAYSADGTTRPRHSMGRGDHAPRRRLTVRGPELEYAELAVVATRLAVKGTANLASRALAEAANRFPVEARQLDPIARIIAPEMSEPLIYSSFLSAVRRTG